MKSISILAIVTALLSPLTIHAEGFYIDGNSEHAELKHLPAVLTRDNVNSYGADAPDSAERELKAMSRITLGVIATGADSDRAKFEALLGANFEVISKEPGQLGHDFHMQIPNTGFDAYWSQSPQLRWLAIRRQESEKGNYCLQRAMLNEAFEGWTSRGHMYIGGLLNERFVKPGIAIFMIIDPKGCLIEFNSFARHDDFLL